MDDENCSGMTEYFLPRVKLPKFARLRILANEISAVVELYHRNVYCKVCKLCADLKLLFETFVLLVEIGERAKVSARRTHYDHSGSDCSDVLVPYGSF